MNIWCVLMLITNPRVSNCALVCVHFCLVVQPSLHLEDDDALFGHNMAEANKNMFDGLELYLITSPTTHKTKTG